ncbi:MAG TPA: glycosyltransferase family 4 protein [Desulfomonilaceae bacterium]|nr:glycosyltransferase family 4 protein [Desulfomonilaceae bacterium]
MKLGLIIYGSLETVSGGFRYDRTLMEYLRSRGDSVEIFSLPWRNYSRHLLDNFSAGLFHSLARANLDVLIQDELNHPSLFRLNRKLKEHAAYPLVSIVHHLRSRESRPEWQNKLYSMVEREYLRSVDGFIFVSRTTSSDVRALTEREAPSVLAYPGRDSVNAAMTTDQIKMRSFQKDALRILFVGSLIQRKELHSLIMALADIPGDIWRLDVVGSLTTDRGYVSGIRQLVEKLKLFDQVSLLGILTSEELGRYYARSQLLAVPSSYEGFGMVYLEGMGFGLPSIASTAGAPHEIITHGRDGFLVRPGNVSAIADHIMELCRNREKLFHMSLNALERYQRHPTWDECTAKIADFLESMVN